MASVKFRLRSSANKNVSIKIRISLDRKNVFELNTGFTINPKDWSEKTDFPKQTSTENKSLSNNLKKLETFILENLNKDLSNGTLINTYWLEEKINECFNRIVATDNGILLNHVQYIIDNASTRKVKSGNGFRIGLNASSVKNYTLFKKIVAEYEVKIKKQIRFAEINKPFVDRFTNWLVNEKKFSTNYAGKQLEILKTVCIDAEKNEIAVNPYGKIIQHFRERDNDRYIQTLSFEELDSIKKAEMPTAKLENARKWILLGCAIGQRGGDLLKIKKEDFRSKNGNYYLDVVQQKTGKSVTIPIVPSVAELIENLPTKVQHQKLNDQIKEVCKIAGIDTMVKGAKLNVETNRKELGYFPKYQLISSHCFRRSFATNYYKKIPTAVLINITGHSKESLFLTYINKREDKDSNADLFLKLHEQLDFVKEPILKAI